MATCGGYDDINHNVPIISTDTSGPVKANLLSTHPVCKQGGYRAMISPR
ncbi:hypothetical protein JMX53_09375 [Cutibacterium avidum]|nr:hypothetical protein [Cutibacterium avidum]QQY14493.1 hypothetical protein JMX53_09375 [Cutibacterium avidum]